jgi:hypothetical protein
MSKGVEGFIEYVNSPAYQDQRLLSSDRSVVSVRSVEIIPRESSTFGYQVNSGVNASDSLNDRMTFHLSDPRHYIDFRNSYFHCEFKCRAVDATGAINLYAYLDEGGIHSLIKNVIIRHGSAEIHRIENYNKLYNIWNLSMHSKEYRERMLHDSGDSPYGYALYGGHKKSFIPSGTGIDQTTGVYTQGNNLIYNDVAQTLAIPGGNALDEMRIGDIFIFTSIVGGVAQGTRSRVIDIISSNILIHFSVALGADISDADANNTFSTVSMISVGANTRKSRRSELVQTATIGNLITNKLKFQLPLGMLMLEPYFPLPFMNQNLEIVLEFVEPALGLVLPYGSGSSTNLLGYQLTRPRFVARMVEPANDVFEAHKRLWADSGLVYRMLDYRAYENQMSSGDNFNFSYQTNIKSAQHIFSVMTEQSKANSASGNNATTQTHASQSTFNKKDLQTFRFRIGGIQYPDYGDVDCSLDATNAQAWAQLQLVLGNMGQSQSGSSIEPWEWNSDTSEKFIMAVNFAKENGVYNTGTNIANNWIEHEMVLNTALVSGTDSQTLHTFIGYDQVLVLSEDDGFRIYY